MVLAPSAHKQEVAMPTTLGETNVATIDLTQAERFVVQQATPTSDEQLITDGHYNDVWSDILTSSWDFVLGEPFTGELEMVLVRAEHFPSRGNIWTRKGVEIMQGFGFRPPTLREMLSFGTQSGSTKWEYVIGANLHYRVSNEPWYDCAPAIWSHSGRRGLTVASMYNAMMHAWPRNPHYLWVSIP
jgi:hypothetical protein